MVRCAYCLITKKNHPERRYFSFPKDPEMSKAWVLACNTPYMKNKTTKQLNVTYKLCSKHFLPEDYASCKKVRLKPDAYPTVFESTPPTNKDFLFMKLKLKQKLEEAENPDYNEFDLRPIDTTKPLTSSLSTKTSDHTLLNSSDVLCKELRNTDCNESDMLSVVPTEPVIASIIVSSLLPNSCNVTPEILDCDEADMLPIDITEPFTSPCSLFPDSSNVSNKEKETSGCDEDGILPIDTNELFTPLPLNNSLLSDSSNVLHVKNNSKVDILPTITTEQCTSPFPTHSLKPDSFNESCKETEIPAYNAVDIPSVNVTESFTSSLQSSTLLSDSVDVLCKKQEIICEKLKTSVEENGRNNIRIVTPKKRKLKILSSKIHNLKKKYQKHSTSEIALNSALKTIRQYVSPTVYQFIMAQVKPSNVHCRQYSIQYINFAVQLYLISARAYNFLKRYFSLPSKRTLLNYMSNM